MKPDLTSLSTIRDPFTGDSVQRLSIVGWISSIDQQWHYTGAVEFQNGLTKASQRFEGSTFNEVARKIEAFGKELEKRG